MRKHIAILMAAGAIAAGSLKAGDFDYHDRWLKENDRYQEDKRIREIEERQDRIEFEQREQERAQQWRDHEAEFRNK